MGSSCPACQPCNTIMSLCSGSLQAWDGKVCLRQNRKPQGLTQNNEQIMCESLDLYEWKRMGPP